MRTTQLPNVSSAIAAWGQTLQFVVVAKGPLEDFVETETFIPKSVKGARVPFKAQSLSMKPIGERAWKWETIFASPSLILKVGDEIIFGEGETRYRVMERRDWSEYGYVEYDICQGYQEC
jgi:hypothetical protein